MATKAQQFRREAERTKPKRAATPPRGAKRRTPATEAGARNLSLRAGKKATVASEESRSGKRSRKSSRPSAHRGKNSTVLEYVARMKSETPHAQHDRK